MPQVAPLPHEVHVPKRSRTKYIAIPTLEPVATTAKVGRLSEHAVRTCCVQWHRHRMADCTEPFRCPCCTMPGGQQFHACCWHSSC